MEDIFKDVLSEDEARQAMPIFKDLLGSVGHLNDKSEVEHALHDKLHAYLPDKDEHEISEYISTITDTLQTDSDKLESLNKAKQSGIGREVWFANETKHMRSRFSSDQTLHYYSTLSETIQQSNEQMYNAIMTNSGNVNMNPSLDGFIAERHHVNTFNMDAAAKGSNLRAEVVGHKGEQFTQNGVDIVIKDGNKVVGRYQSKFCKDSTSTNSALKQGDYRGQQALVPSDQLEEITEKGRKATDVISHDGVSSKPLSKAEAKEMQEKAQNGKLQEYSYNDFEVKQLALGVGKQAANAALMGAAVTTGFVIAEKVVMGEEITADELIETAIKAGADTGVKAAVSGSLIIASEKGIISAIPKGTPAGTISSLAFIIVENVKIFGKVATGELSATEGLSRMMDTTMAAVTGLSVSFVASAEIGVAVGLLLGPVAGVIAGFAAGAIGYIAGSKIGQAISKGVKTVAKAAFGVVKTVGKAIISTGKKVVNTVKNVAENAWSGIKSLFGR